MALAVSALSFALPACTSSSASTVPRNGADKQSNSSQLALVTSSNSHWWQVVVSGARAYEKEAGVKVQIRMPEEGAVEQQNAILRELVAGGVGGIAVDPIDPAAQRNVLNEVAARTHLVTFMDDAPESKRELHVGSNQYLMGQALGQEVVRLLPKGGEVAVFVGAQSHVTVVDRLRGIRDAVKGRSIEISGVHEDQADREKARENVRAVLGKGTRPSLLLGLWSYNGPAIAQVLEETRCVGKVHGVVTDEERGTLDAIEKGTLSSSIVQKPSNFGYLASKCMHALATRREDAGCVPDESKSVDTGVEVVTKETVQEFRHRLEDAGVKP